MRRGSILQVVVIGVIAGAIAGAVAYFVPWLPKPATLESERIDWVFWFVTIICIVIFALVSAVIIYSVIHFRVAPDDDTDGPPIHGHTGLEIVWTAVPAILVTAIGVFSAIVLAKNDALGKNPLHIDVTAQQFAWSFKYPESNGLASTELRLPVNRSIQLRIHAKDVLHSFWVPQFGQKQDAVPGIITTLHITPTRVGRFPIKCTELCGLGHARHARDRDRDARGGVRRLGREAGPGPERRRSGRRQGAVRVEQLRRVPHAEGRRSDRKGRPRPR